MKISKTILHQIIKEEAQTLLEVGTEPMTRYAKRKGPEARRRDKDREQVKDFFGSDDPLVTKTKEEEPVDPNKTIARSPEDIAARAAEFDAAEPKQATDRQLNDPDRIVITAFDSDVRAKLLETYASETGIEIDDRPLGHGEFGIVYEGENPEYGPVAVKMTLSGQEINAYKNIKKLKDGLASRDPFAANALPAILDIRTIVSPPVGPEGDIRAGRYIEKEGGRPYKVFVVQMELLEKLNSETRVDVFGPDPSEENYSPEVRKRFVEEYLTIENIYSSLEKLLDGELWEKLVDQVVSRSVSEGSLPIRDEKLFPPFREIEKILPRLRKAYLDAPADAQFFALHNIHNILKNAIVKVFTKYVDDESLLEQLSNYAGPILRKQMAANARLPQYDPEAIAASPGLRAGILPPSEIQSRVAKSFYERLKKLEQWDAQYGDVHASNVMQRGEKSFHDEHHNPGDLVVADVGLFMFGPQGSRGYAASIVERLQHLAGIILK